MRKLAPLLVLLLLSPALPAPILIRPENSSTVQNPVELAWIPHENADNQRLKVDNDPDFSSPEVEVVLGPAENSYTLVLDCGIYWWGIWAAVGGTEIPPENTWWFRVSPGWNLLEEWSAPCLAPVPPPLPLSPENSSNTNDNTPTLSWTTTLPVDFFQLQVDDQPDFSVPEIDTQVSETFCEVPALPDNVYFWRVRGFRSGSCSEWSAVWEFRVDTIPPAEPSPLTPLEGETFTNSVPTFSWSPPRENSLPLTFLVVVDNDPDFSSPAIQSGWITGENWVPPALGQENYYWRVRARDNAGNEGNWSPTRGFTILDTIPPSPPTPVHPFENENLNDNTPLLSWHPPEENSLPLTYCVQVSPDRYEIFASAWTDSENWVCPELSDGSWYWRVCARDAAGNTGLFFPWTHFVIDTVPPSPPPLLAPEPWADIHGTIAKLEWGEGSDDRTGIHGYLVQISLDPSFSTPRAEIFLTGNALLHDFLELGEWFWRVGSVDWAGNTGWSENRGLACRGWRELETLSCMIESGGRWRLTEDLSCSLSGLAGVWTEVENLTAGWATIPGWMTLQQWRGGVLGFARWLEMEKQRGILFPPVPTPSPLLPENGSHVSRVVLRWENSKTADNFEIQTDIPSRFWRPFRFTYTTWFSTENWVELPSENLKEGPYLWRVRQWRSGACSPWSEVWCFTLDRSTLPPALLLPENGKNLKHTQVTFNWAEVQDVTPPLEYEVQVSQDPSFQSFVSSGWISHRIWEHDTGGEGVYYWRVRSRDGLGNVSQPSVVRNFRIDLTPPPAPNLLSPPSGVWLTSSSVRLTWEMVEDNSRPVTYMVFIDDDPSFSSPNLALQASENFLAVTVPDGRWHWRVIAADNAGNLSTPSQGGFNVDATPPPVPTQISPSATLLTTGRINFSWGRVEDPNGVYYDFRIEGVLLRENLRENSYLLSPLEILTPGSYSWRVRARDGLGNTRGWSAPVSFEVRDIKPPSLQLLEPTSKIVAEDFLLKVKLSDDFGLKENATRLKVDGMEEEFSLENGLLTSHLQGLPAGEHELEILAVDVGGNENRLSLSVQVEPQFGIQLRAENCRAGEPLLLRILLYNRTENSRTRRLLLFFGDQVKKLEVSLGPREERCLDIQLKTEGLEPSTYTIRVLDLETGKILAATSVQLRAGFPFYLLTPIALGVVAGVGLRLRRKPAFIPAIETPPEEFPLPLPPAPREEDEYTLRALLFRPEVRVSKEWSRLTKKYGAQLSPLMAEYARLLRGPPPSLISRYEKMVKGRRTD
ncbi:MAG: hypothetical protein QXR87_04935 [Candidatus Hadarchaeales archaeon]